MKLVRFVLDIVPGILRHILAPLHLSPAVSQVTQHIVLVFLATFLGQVVAGAAGAYHAGTLWALVVAAASAGVTAAWHYVDGLIPAPVAKPAPPSKS